MSIARVVIVARQRPRQHRLTRVHRHRLTLAHRHRLLLLRNFAQA